MKSVATQWKAIFYGVNLHAKTHVKIKMCYDYY